MIQIVQVPVAWAMTKEAKFFAENAGKMPEIQAAREEEAQKATAQLSKFLDDGYELLSTVVVEVTSRTLLMYTLHKPTRAVEKGHYRK